MNTIVRFTGKNFPTWQFQFKMFLKGKELSHHLDSSILVPTDEKELAQYEVKMLRLSLGYWERLSPILSPIFGVLLLLKLCGPICIVFITKITTLGNSNWSWKLALMLKVI
jgi:hypothetical protein